MLGWLLNVKAIITLYLAAPLKIGNGPWAVESPKHKYQINLRNSKMALFMHMIDFT